MRPGASASVAGREPAPALPLLSSVGAAVLVIVSVTLPGCSITRIEDVPTAQMLDSQGSAAQRQSLSVPPDMAAAPVSTSPVPTGIGDAGPLPLSGEAAAALPAEPEFADNPSSGAGFETASWVARYSEGGIDAENRDGDYCSGRQEWDGPDLKSNQRVRVACSDGRSGTFLVEKDATGMPSAALVFGKSRETAIVIAQ